VKNKRTFLLFFLLCFLCILFSSNSYAVTMQIGDIDSFGFDELSSLVGADGKPVDRNNNGILDSGDVLPDLNRNGYVAVGHGDDFDNRTDDEINDLNGSKWTDVVLLKPTTIGPGPANNAEFIFNFDVPQIDASDYGKDHFFSFVYADYDVNPMYAVIEGDKLNLLGNSDGGADGFIWRAYSVISWNDMLDGEVHIKIVAPGEPYVAFDYALLDLQPISVCDYIIQMETMME